MGDGKQKVTAYYGRYYDPIRNNMTNFAGSHSGRTREEQVFANGQWVTYRVARRRQPGRDLRAGDARRPTRTTSSSATRSTWAAA